MEEKNKNKLIIILCIIVVLLLVAIAVVTLSKKDKFNPTGNISVVSTLEAGSQEEIDNVIKKDLKDNNYSLDNAKVYLDPYGKSPLSALIIFKTDKSVSAEVTVKGKNNNDLTNTYEKATEHYIPVFGLYENYENTVLIKLEDGTSAEVKIKVDKIEEIPETRVNSSNKEVLKNEDMYFISSPITMNSFAFDSYGDLRWITRKMWYHDIVMLENGHMLIGTEDNNEFGLCTKILEIDYLGRIYKEYEIEEGYLNNIFVKKDGNIIVASKNKDRETFSDYIIEIDKNTGKIVKTFDIYELFNNIDAQFNNGKKSDYYYNSGIEYYEDTDSLLLTYWGGEFVVNLSYTEGNIKWIFSNPANFTSSFDKYLLTGNITYPKSMHSAHLIGNTFKVLDNGYSTNKGDANSANLIGSYSSANTYEIDGKNISLKTSSDENKKYFSYALGDFVTNNNDELILFGRELVGLNYSDGVDINLVSSLSSLLLEKVNGETVLDMSIGVATHMVSKVKINNINFNFDTINKYTSLVPSKKEPITSDIITKINEATETVPYDFGYSNNYIESNVYYMDHEEANLILVNSKKEGAVYKLKVKGNSSSLKIVTDLAKGKYYIYIMENGTMYKTDKYIEIK